MTTAVILISLLTGIDLTVGLLAIPELLGQAVAFLLPLLGAG